LGTKIENATTHKISLSREAYNELKEKGHVGRKVRPFVSIDIYRASKG